MNNQDILNNIDTTNFESIKCSGLVLLNIIDEKLKNNEITAEDASDKMNKVIKICIGLMVLNQNE
jgi:hypothetical protein